MHDSSVAFSEKNKNKKVKTHHKKFISAKLIMTIMCMSTGFGYGANAASLSLGSDTLSDSGVGQTTQHSVQFSSNLDIPAGGYFDITFPIGFGNIIQAADIVCPASATSTVENASRTARCTSASGIASSTALVTTISNIVNPVVVGSYAIAVSTYDSGAGLLQASNLQVAITERVVVTATVQSSLTFIISPVASDTPVKGVVTTGPSATSTLDFGYLQFGSSSILAQELSVQTNATWGYVVTVEQDQDLSSANGASIHAFKDASPQLIPQNWSIPTSDINSTSTFGHLGVTTDDTATNFNEINNDEWVGFSGVTPLSVMTHNGPTAGIGKGLGTTTVAYRIEVSPLQQAGDYTNTLTYICTPTF